MGNRIKLVDLARTIDKSELESFYSNHLPSETCVHFNIKSKQQLLKLLKFFSIPIHTASENTRLQMSHMSPKDKEMRSKKISVSMSDFRHNSSTEVERLRTQRILQTKSAWPSEYRECVNRKISLSVTDVWAGRDKNLKEEIVSKRLCKMNSKSREELRAIQDKIKVTNDNKSACEKAEIKRKRANSRKAYYSNLSVEDRAKLKSVLSKSQLELEQDPIRKATKLSRYLDTISQRTEEEKQQIVNKGIATKRKNNSFNKSQPEEDFYNYLKGILGEDDIIRQYNDDRYPFACDFYIKSKDLFIECNYHWTHGGHPFNAENEADVLKLNLWQKKAESCAKRHNFYARAVYVWSDLDVRKLNTARQGNLNFICLYDGEALLSEGNEELTDLREKLRLASQLTYPID